ncbi:MAG: alpha/beta fold hydrolase [Nevskia sp.]|nr:alpha/beta fold hydrolase [Nevskia sp.]
MRTFLKAVAVLLLAAVAALAGLALLAPARFAELAMDGERAAAGLHRAQTDIPGFHIVYLEGGHGEPLLLLHGFGADKDNWTRVSRYLTRHFHVIAPDLPGFGESGKAAEADYGIPAQTARIAQLAEALHLQHFDLGGNSMGGWLAAAYAAAHPQQVRSLWLLAPAGVAGAQPSELFKRVSAGGDNPLLVRTPAQFRSLMDFVFVKPPFVPGAVLQVLAQRRADNYALEQKIFGQLLASPPLEPQVAGLATPAVIVWGDQDRALDVSGAAILHKLMPQSQVRIVRQMGHAPMIEAPRATAEDYLRFRAELH